MTYDAPMDLEDELERDVHAARATSNERTWGMVAHLSSLAGIAGLAFGWILGPLIVWIIKKDESAFVRAHATEALNFGISISIYAIVAALSLVVVVGIVLLPVVLIAAIVFPIIAGMKANEGRVYRYPYILRFVN